MKVSQFLSKIKVPYYVGIIALVAYPTVCLLIGFTTQN